MSTEQTINHGDQFVSSDWRSVASRVIEAIVGAVLLIAGLLKATDPAAFAKQIAAYKIVTSAGTIGVLAWILILVECILGAALIVGFMRRIMVPATIALFGVFLSGLAWAWHTGATADCGCFGAWA